jgi:hypothetical protein
MSEIHHAVDHWVEKNKKDEFKKGLNQGIKQGESGMLITILLVMIIGYGIYKYNQSHSISIGVKNQQVLGVKSVRDDKQTNLQQIPSSEITLQNSEGVQLKSTSNSLEATVMVDVDTTSQVKAEPKRGIFQPKTPNVTISTIK